MQDIGTVNYYKCQSCGFVLSKTHSELDENKWADLNRMFHHYIENPQNERTFNQPPYAKQHNDDIDIRGKWNFKYRRYN